MNIGTLTLLNYAAHKPDLYYDYHFSSDFKDFVYLNKDKWLHKDKGPALIRPQSSIPLLLWAKNGNWHRTDGPAFCYMNDPQNNTYYINGEMVDKNYRKLKRKK